MVNIEGPQSSGEMTWEALHPQERRLSGVLPGRLYPSGADVPSSSSSSSGVSGRFAVQESLFGTPSSASRRTTEQFTPPQPARQQPRTEEGDVQGQEQQPETRRTVVPQGSPQGSTGTEHFDLSPEKAGLIDIGVDDDEPIFVKHDELPDEKILELGQEQSANKAGDKLIVEVLRATKNDLQASVHRSALPLTTTDKLSQYFPTWDKTKLVCFLYICSSFRKLDNHFEDNIKDPAKLTRDVASYCPLYTSYASEEKQMLNHGVCRTLENKTQSTCI